MKKVVKVPKEVYLKDYEFFLKVRGYPIHIFKSPDVIIKNPKKYEIDEETEEKINALQIERYYRVYDQRNFTLRKATKESQEKDVPNAPIPPYTLQIGE